MTNEEIKKELQKAVKAHQSRRKGHFYASMTMGKKQMENRTALISCGYVVEERYSASEMHDDLVNSAEFINAIKKVGATWHDEIRKVYGDDALYIVVKY